MDEVYKKTYIQRVKNGRISGFEEDRKNLQSDFNNVMSDFYKSVDNVLKGKSYYNENKYACKQKPKKNYKKE
jgi:hypothetical protein